MHERSEAIYFRDCYMLRSDIYNLNEICMPKRAEYWFAM